MGTRVVVTVDGQSSSTGMAWSEVVLSELRRVERMLSTWDPSSELSSLNAAALDRPIVPGPDVAEWLARASELASRTGGTFDISVGALIDAWDLRGSGRRPGPVELERALSASGVGAISVDPVTGAVTRHDPAAWIDAGGFGKGAALLAAARRLESDSVAMLLDLGGQLWLSPHARARHVQVAHPANRAHTVGRLLLPPGQSVATSGLSERSVSLDGERLGHILDPRNGRPAPPWGSVTVVSDDPVEADALSTALYVMGPEAGAEWAEAQGDIAALFLVDEAGGVRAHWTGPMTSLLPQDHAGSPSFLFEPNHPSSF
jgi:thiamine biosynthesis lipoprotein